MKKNKIYFAISMIALYITSYSTSSCERDDICAEDAPTTPHIIIKFINDTDRTRTKRPANLEIRSVDETITDSLPNVINKDSIRVPLRADLVSELTDFRFILNSDDTTETRINSDIISFQYKPKEEYVSSACGFRVVYDDLNVSIDNSDPNTWIKDIEVLETKSVKNENAAHVLIFH